MIYTEWNFRIEALLMNGSAKQLDRSIEKLEEKGYKEAAQIFRDAKIRLN